MVQSDLKTKKVLVAEDDPDYMFLCKRMLKDYEVVCASNGVEVVKQYKKQKPDFVLMDIRMPLMNGDTAIKEILDFDSNARIVAMTVYDYREDELGVEVLKKGFGRKELLSIVEKYLSGDA